MPRTSFSTTVALGAATTLVVAVALVLFLQPDEEADGPPTGLVLESAGRDRTVEAPAVMPDPARGGTVPSPPPRQVDAPVHRLGPKELRGLVVDDETGHPVPAFQVLVLPHDGERHEDRLDEAVPTRIQDRTGVFRISKQEGRWDVEVRAPGYLPASRPGLWVPAENLDPVVIRLQRGPSIVGHVLDENGFPALGVEVFLDQSGPTNRNGHPEMRRLRASITRTDADGRFRFSPLIPGEYAVSLLEPDNRVDRLAPIRVGDGAVEVMLVLTPKHELTVIVRNPNGQPLTEARVRLEGGGHTFRAPTQPNGQVLLRHVPDGEYDLRVECAGFVATSERLVLRNGSGQMARWFTLAREEGP